MQIPEYTTAVEVYESAFKNRAELNAAYKAGLHLNVRIKLP